MSKSHIVRYAIPVANGQLCQHFGHCEQFALVDFDTEQHKIVKHEQHTPPPHEPGVLPRWLHEQGAHIIIAGGMGMRAQNLFSQNGISVIVGAAETDPQKLVQSHATGALETGENACSH